jgi:hypothetical protein
VGNRFFQAFRSKCAPSPRVLDPTSQRISLSLCDDPASLIEHPQNSVPWILLSAHPVPVCWLHPVASLWGCSPFLLTSRPACLRLGSAATSP